jgi:hypothetical protein
MGTPIDPGTVQGDVNAPGPNPAWNDVLSNIPSEYHPMLTENFTKWDQAAQTRVEAANAKVKEFEPYQAFVENQIPPDELENGLRLMYEVQTNPQEVWTALGKAYNLTPGELQQVQRQAASEGITDPNQLLPGNQQQAQPQIPAQQFNDPRVDQLQKGIELVSQIVLQDQQAKQAAAADIALEKELKDLETKHGAFDQGYVLAMMNNGMEGDAAVQAFQSLRNSVIQGGGQSFAPDVIGNSSGGSGYPSQAIDPTKLDDKGTRNLVQKMLEAANRQ